jgi:hypothetical protein
MLSEASYLKAEQIGLTGQIGLAFPWQFAYENRADFRT